MVGVARLELVASWSRTKHATKLRYTPMHSAKIIIADFYGLVKSSRKKIRKAEAAVLLHIPIHMLQHPGVLRFFRQILPDVPDSDDGVDLDAELVHDLGYGGLPAFLSHFAAVHGNEHIRNFHVCRTL